MPGLQSAERLIEIHLSRNLFSGPPGSWGDLLGVAEPVPFGPFLGVQVDNAVTLAFADDDRARAAEATGPSDHDLDPRGQASSERG